MSHIRIGRRLIGLGAPVYIIAEGCDNHLGDLKKAKDMCLLAKKAGADAIKFQHHLPDEEMLPDLPLSSNFNIPLYEFLKRYALTLNQHKELKNFCEKIGIQYLCTPFSFKAAEELLILKVDAFKIGSGEMTDTPTLKKIAAFGKPMIVSTGMCTFKEIDRTYKMLVQTGIPLALTNCVSEYPPVYEDINLKVITKMIKRYPRAVIGHSDHTPDLVTCFAAVAYGAKIIEKHVILDKQQPGPDQSVSIDFDDLAELVDGIRKIERASGNKKLVHKKEKQIRAWAFRSIVSTRNIKKGEVVKEDMIWSKRPGTGIPSYMYSKLIGLKAKKDIPANTLLAWRDFKQG
ncbi:MAG: N-acetylneuraminate synthase family protein [Candidatus Omnitrophica bacterium]|nr:N-acetylneuraminate synthase family protein [Candidatus Omnitrophota bacterium]